MTNPPGAMPPLPELSYLGDDVSYGYDAEDLLDYAKAYAALLIARVAELESALQAYADRQYCLGIEQLRRPECLGWEHKLKTGKFGDAEMAAHKKANEHFGAHFGIYAAIKATKD